MPDPPYFVLSCTRLTLVSATPTTMASTDEPVPQDENLRLADLRYTASTAASASEREDAAAALKEAIIIRKAVPLLIDVSAELVRFLSAWRIFVVSCASSSVLFALDLLMLFFSSSDMHPVLHMDLAVLFLHYPSFRVPWPLLVPTFL